MNTIDITNMTDSDLDNLLGMNIDADVESALADETTPGGLAARFVEIFGESNVQLVGSWDTRFWVRLPNGRFCDVFPGAMERLAGGEYRSTWNVKTLADMISAS